MLTPEKREALLLARDKIAQHKIPYICWALEAVEMGRPDLTRVCQQLKMYISKMIFPSDSLANWQERRGMRRSVQQIRADRIAWIDWMLDEMD